MEYTDPVFLEGEALRSSVKLFSFSRAIAACPRNRPSDFGKNRFPKSRTKSAVPETNAQRFLFSSLFFLPFFLRRNLSNLLYVSRSDRKIDDARFIARRSGLGWKSYSGARLDFTRVPRVTRG